MIDVSGHTRPLRRDIGFENKDISLEINCAGYQLFNDIDFVKRRPAGRLDYQIIYLTKGKGLFLVNDSYIEADAGSLIVYKPGEVQCYRYLGKDCPEIYWVHFTGRDCEKFLNERNVIQHFYEIGSSPEICLTFKNIIFELQLKKENYSEVTVHLFKVLLFMIERSIKVQKDVMHHTRKIDKLILYLNDAYSKNISIKEMAEFCNMSESRFQHLFKEQQGISAKQYILRLRIERAKAMMLSGNITIGMAAKQVGFNDPLYFSRMFKKLEGLTPKEFLHQ